MRIAGVEVKINRSSSAGLGGEAVAKNDGEAEDGREWSALRLAEERVVALAVLRQVRCVYEGERA